MTVCIAATCEGGKRIVVAADRMFTLSAPASLEFETQEKKIESLANGCVLLSSGNSAYAKEILSQSLDALEAASAPKLAHVAEVVKGSFVKVRAAKTREQVLLPMLGPDFIKFDSMSMPLPQYLQFQPAVFQQLSSQMFTFNLGLDLLVCGIDASGAHIVYIGHPGTTAWLDKLGYAAIGSGGIHAQTRLSLASQTRDETLARTVLGVYQAKKAAEAAPGVGNATDMAIVDSAQVAFCGTEVLAELDEFLGDNAPPLQVPEKLSALLASFDVG